MAGYVNHDVWKTRLKPTEVRLITALKDIIVETVKEENEKKAVETSSWEDTYGDGNLHCSHCGAILEPDELNRHNWYYCYHCGNKMSNPYGGKTETTASDGSNGRYLYCER